ncbi:MAG: hypothetical protein KDE53_23880 [Caldilineaceae bacterium]|nr:hypothetical protein [Anaerolineae bacterium]MCA9908795.1 hypothetical protein [Anaerolineae bacterium]MCB0108991.1 hypothetical protein [Caldilineaceae bacterium]
MRLRIIILFSLILLAIAACDGPPPTMVVLVVTATPDASVMPTDAVTATVDSTPESTQASVPATVTATPTSAATPTNAPTPTPDVFPTPTVGQIQVAEQLFQRGRMFWVQPTQQLWVLTITGEGRGTWTIYPDTFEDGVDPDLDPALVAPEGLIQPERGFGKLWRNNPEVREALGWATTPEFGYVSDYEYHPGGTVDAQGEYVAAPGYHILYSLYREQFRFNEVDSTWQLGGG